MNALFIGYGRMGGAIGDAWLSAGLVESLTAVDPHLQSAANATLFNSLDAVPATPFDIIVVAVKPAYACEVLAALPDALCQQAVVISVAAGVTSASLAESLGNRCPVVRAMPNTPVLVGAGCTGLYANSSLDETKRALVTRLFAAVGTAHWVEREELLDAVTAISGSGPAYYHLFSEALAAQTALGAATLQTQPEADFVALRTAVTSPNGTTAAAIAAFEQDQALRKLVDTAARAAHQRSEELSRGA